MTSRFAHALVGLADAVAAVLVVALVVLALPVVLFVEAASHKRGVE